MYLTPANGRIWPNSPLYPTVYRRYSLKFSKYWRQLWREVIHVRTFLILKHYVIMLIYPFAIFIVYVVSKNGIYVMLYKYLSDSI
jgi:predicted AlkP superfamily phosphohydrolase/phosphomutase